MNKLSSHSLATSSTNSSGAASVVSSELDESAGSSDKPAIPPLGVSGLIVAKADLVAALRLYVPQLVDIMPLDGTRFELILTVPNQGNEGGN